MTLSYEGKMGNSSMLIEEDTPLSYIIIELVSLLYTCSPKVGVKIFSLNYIVQLK